MASQTLLINAPFLPTGTKGQRVEEGERVLVLEAMKMETDVAAPRAGTVAEGRVKPGDAVAVGDVLLTIGG